MGPESITPVLVSLLALRATWSISVPYCLPYPGTASPRALPTAPHPSNSLSDLPIHVAYKQEFDDFTESLHGYAGLHVPFGWVTYMDRLAISVALTPSESPPPSGYSSLAAISRTNRQIASTHSSQSHFCYRLRAVGIDTVDPNFALQRSDRSAKHMP